MQKQKHFKKRDAILACLRGTDTHPSAEWVYTELKEQITDLSLGTVYRNIARFKEIGEIISVGTVKGIERYDGNTEPHVHFICTDCGAILDLMNISVPEELKSSAEYDCGGSVTTCSLTFTGLCSKCKNKN